MSNATRELFFSSPTSHNAAALAAALQRAGYLVPDQPDHIPAEPELGIAEDYEVVAYTGYDSLAGPDTVLAAMEKIRQDVQRLAEEHGCRHTGSGEFIGSLDLVLGLGDS